jgi:hypothetical protein
MPKNTNYKKAVTFFTPEKTKQTLVEFEAQLVKDGAKKLGAGAFGRVYTNPYTNHGVIKVGYEQAHGREFDPYLAFLKAIPEKNPLFPKVFAVVRYAPEAEAAPGVPAPRHAHAPYYAVHMEELKPSNHEKFPDAVSKLGVKWMDQFSRWDNEVNKLAKTTKKGYVKQGCEVLMALYKKYNCDLHGGNYMVRLCPKKGPQVVITDPVC